MSGLYDKDTGAAYGTHKTYIKGFVFSVIITTIAFALVGFKVFSPLASCIAVAVLALTQLFVQLVYFLHLSTESTLEISSFMRQMKRVINSMTLNVRRHMGHMSNFRILISYQIRLQTSMH